MEKFKITGGRREFTEAQLLEAISIAIKAGYEFMADRNNPVLPCDEITGYVVGNFMDHFKQHLTTFKNN